MAGASDAAATKTATDGRSQPARRVRDRSERLNAAQRRAHRTRRDGV